MSHFGLGFVAGALEADITWNPSDKSASISLSNGNLNAASTTSSQWHNVRATVPRSAGKRYFEILAIAPASGNIIFGLGDAAFTLANNNIGNTANSAGTRSAGSFASGYTLAQAGAPGGTDAINDVWGFACDIAGGKVYLRKNGTWVFSSDPVAGTNPWLTGVTGSVFPAVGLFTTTSIVQLVTKYAQFSAAPPTGYLSWATN